MTQFSRLYLATGVVAWLALIASAGQIFGHLGATAAIAIGLMLWSALSLVFEEIRRHAEWIREAAE